MIKNSSYLSMCIFFFLLPPAIMIGMRLVIMLGFLLPHHSTQKNPSNFFGLKVAIYFQVCFKY